MFEVIDLNSVQTFNESVKDSGKKILRPFDNRNDYSNGDLESGYGSELVIVIPFTHEVRLKAISLIPNEKAPTTMKLYKNEENVDI